MCKTQGPEISNNVEGDPVGKPLNTTETTKRYQRLELRDTAAI